MKVVKTIKEAKKIKLGEEYITDVFGKNPEDFDAERALKLKTSVNDNLKDKDGS